MQITQLSKMSTLPPALWYSPPMSSVLRHQGDDGEYTQKPFGKALRQLRKRRNLTQGELAALVGVAGHSTVATWELRAEPIDDDEMMERLAAVLGVSVDSLAEGKVPTERVMAQAFEQAVEQLARAHLPAGQVETAVTIWRDMHQLTDQDIETIKRVVRAMALAHEVEEAK